MRVNDLEDKAKEAAGNWKKFSDFACQMDDWDFPDCVTTMYTSNRDSGIAAESNEQAILEAMKPYLDNGTAKTIRHTHWACGYVDGLEILVYDENGGITPAFKEMWEIGKALENYPLLDEEDWSRREYEDTLENIVSAVSSWGWRKDEFDAEKLPKDYASQMFSWFWENDQEAVESRDDGGGYPSDEQVKACLIALGWYKEAE